MALTSSYHSSPCRETPSQTPSCSSGASIWNNLYFLVWWLCSTEPNDCFYLFFRCLITVEHFNTIKLKQATSSFLIVAWLTSKWRLQQYQIFNSHHTLANFRTQWENAFHKSACELGMLPPRREFRQPVSSANEFLVFLGDLFLGV